MKSKTLALLCIITFVAVAVRFWQLGVVPIGFHRDEAFLGYNAYSLLKTGRDMTGHILPIHLESFLYSPDGYSYASIPFIFLFDLSPFSVRFASAFFGVLTVVATFFLVQTMLQKERTRDMLGLFSAFIVAITPWHINLSRVATENILVAFFITIGVISFVIASRRNSIVVYVVSFIFFGVTLTIYQAPRVFLPLFIPVLLLLYSKIHKRTFTSFFPIILFLVVIVTPMIIILKSPKLMTRLNMVSIFSTKRTQLLVAEQESEDIHLHIPHIISRLFHNKILGYSEQFLDNYFQHLSFSFLFTDQGLPDRYRVPGSGLLYLSFIPLLIIGILRLSKKYPKEAFVLISWILLSLVGSALTFDDIPNLQRTVMLFPALSIVIAYGLTELLVHRSTKWLKAATYLLLVLLTYEGSRYLYHYYVQQIAHRPWYRQEGYKQLVEQVNSGLHNHSYAIITNSETAPGLFFLFFGKYDPQKYITETRNSTNPYFDRVDFGPYKFTIDECPLLEKDTLDPKTGESKAVCYEDPNILYVNSGLCKISPVCGKVISQIYRSDGTRVFTLLDMSPVPATVSALTRPINR